MFDPDHKSQTTDGRGKRAIQLERDGEGGREEQGRVREEGRSRGE